MAQRGQRRGAQHHDEPRVPAALRQHHARDAADRDDGTDREIDATGEDDEREPDGGRAHAPARIVHLSRYAYKVLLLAHGDISPAAAARAPASEDFPTPELPVMTMSFCMAVVETRRLRWAKVLARAA